MQHKFQMDNDPKHTSHYIRDFLKSNKIYWWKTPAESPDLNPTEKVRMGKPEKIPAELSLSQTGES